ncbi:MAG: trehalose-phosphatase [Ferroplasma sp.]|uniref:trehalose-phosphatase n=1 Tax=Ferroplasma sp. TaxID=2591003 RepID=UPI0028158708|nr:trehalose-phosphatase [Ferroplasma sp.]WMT52044.1 MAG: trehalose-phosphatase [Ferroplasma sp.]
MNENKLFEIARDMKYIVPQIFLDYDGTLVPIVKDPELNQADGELMNLLSSFARVYETYIVTGRDLKEISNFIGEYNIIGLHGAIFHINGETLALPGFQKYEEISMKIYRESYNMVDKFQGLRIYRKSGGVLFHTGNITDKCTIKSLKEAVKSIALRYNMELYTGIDIIELRIPGVNKGSAIKMVRNVDRQAIIIGDDATDEDAFKLNPDAITVKVGHQSTVARYSICYSSVRPFLRALLK